MDYVFYVIKHGYSMVLIASRIPKKQIEDLLTARGFDGFIAYAKRSSRVSIVLCASLGVGRATH